MPSDAAARNILIHHPAAHADEVVLGALTNLGDLDRIEPEAAFGEQSVRDQTSSAAEELKPAPIGTSLQTTRSAPERLRPLISNMSATPKT